MLSTHWFLGSVTAGLGAAPQMSYPSVLSSQYSAEPNWLPHPATLKYWLTQFEPLRFLRFQHHWPLWVKACFPIPVWLPSGHPLFPRQDSSSALAVTSSLWVQESYLALLSDPILIFSDLLLDPSTEADSNPLFFWLFFCRQFLSQCNLFGGRLETVIIDYQYIRQCKSGSLQLFLFCGTF